MDVEPYMAHECGKIRDQFDPEEMHVFADYFLASDMMAVVRNRMLQ